jgi:hypothetical protein
MMLNLKNMILISKQNNSVLLGLLFIGLGFLPSQLLAQSSLALSVAPAIFEMNASPGQTWESTLRVINTNPFELTVYAEVVNFRPAGEDGTAQFVSLSETERDNSTLGEWVSVPDSALVIAPEQTLEIPVRITLPIDTPPGGHYASILVGTRPPVNSE